MMDDQGNTIGKAYLELAGYGGGAWSKVKLKKTFWVKLNSDFYGEGSSSMIANLK